MNKKIAVIGGTSLEDWHHSKIMFFNRHGEKRVMPHKVDHRGNMLKLRDAGIGTAIGICSAGSMRVEIKPGSIMIPDDFFCFHPATFFSGSDFRHMDRQLDQAVRQKLLSAAEKVVPKEKLVAKGTYYQSHGPGFETQAEINFYKTLGQVLGMTMADEATVAREAGIKYASICEIGNYAPGIGEGSAVEAWEKSKGNSHDLIIAVLDKFLS